MKRLLSILLAVLLLASALPLSAFAETKYTVYVSSTGSGTLSLREGPGKDYDVIGYVYHGDKVTKLKTSGEWSRVQTSKNKKGWIKTKYIDGTTKKLGTGYKYVETGGGSINLRTGPGTDYSSKGSVKNGAKVKVLNTEDNWVKVTVQSSGATGWIMAKYISGSSPAPDPDPEPTPSTQKVYHVTASNLSVRTGPGTGYAETAKIYTNRAFKVLSSSGNWFKIKTLTGSISGWVSKTYAASGATATVTASSLNIRKSASASSAIVKTLYYGAKVTVTAVTGNWAKVTSGGKTGYMSMNYLKF